ncbi:MAG: hypothetical protein WC277_12965 [Bacilli bacterium]
MTVLDLMYLAMIAMGAALLLQSVVLAVVCWKLVKHIRLSSHESWVRDYNTQFMLQGIERILGIRKTGTEEHAKDVKGHQ